MTTTKLSTLDKVIAGLQILRKYGDNFCAEHDQIWAGGDDNVVTAEDAARLEELGWFKASEGGWSHFA